MTTTWLLSAGLVFMVVLSIAIDRLGRKSGGRLWALAWVCLYASGVASDHTDTSLIARIVDPVVATAFCTLLYAGTLRFTGRTVPRWLLGLAIADMCIRPLALLALSEPFTHAVDSAYVIVASLASTWILIPQAQQSRSGWAWSLAAGMPLLAVSNLLYAMAKLEHLPEAAGVFACVTAGTIVAIAQLAALFERSERLAREGRATLEALVEALPVGLALTDRNDTIHTLNSSMAQQLELEARRFIGQPLDRLVEHARTVVRPLVPPETTPHGEAGVRPFGSAQRVLERELSFRDGRSAVAESRPVPGPGAARSPIGHLWFVRDVTEERRLHRDLQEARQLETLARLAGGVAHDFNNKLTAVLGNASLVRDGLDSEDWRAEALGDLEDAAQYCAALTRDLLDFARQSPTHSTSLPTEETLHQIASNLQSMIPEGIVFAVETRPGTPPLSADPAQLERVISNLVLNARDACGDQGRVKILASRCDEDGSVEIRVSDDGAGMSAEMRERVFDPFYSTKEIGQGTGLGLAIVFGIVKAHGGRIEVETEPGVGTTFVTRWPAAAATSPGETRATTSEARRADASASERILVVEDEAPVRRVLRTTLERAGYQVIEAENGESALELANELGYEIDLAVVDLTMPGLSGKETIEALRTKNDAIPVILVSGHFGQAKDDADSRSPSPDRITHLAKPFLPEQLLEVARQAITPG